MGQISVKHHKNPSQEHRQQDIKHITGNIAKWNILPQTL